jgi:broad specificity phosphatase PhoE
VELSDLGKKQAAALGLSLKEQEINAVYSSPLVRALDTANAIAKPHGLPVQAITDFRELDCGDLEGVFINSLNSSFIQYLVKWEQQKDCQRLPGGESLIDLADRTWSATTEILKTHHHLTVVLVSHYFVTLSIICKALDIPLYHLSRMRIQVGSISMLDFNNSKPCLVSLGDTCHFNER